MELWRDFPEQLAVATRRRVVAYDRLGFGRSNPYPGALPLTFIRDEGATAVPRLLEALGVNEIIAFGHSVGGGMANKRRQRGGGPGAVVDVESNPLHCGSCEARCPFHETCVEGACVCDERFAVCGGRCVNLAVDPAHCGACGAACAPGLFCQGGACACAAGDYEDIGSTVPQLLTGTTVGAETYFSLACMGAGSTEFVYRFTAEEAGRYRFEHCRIELRHRHRRPGLRRLRGARVQ